MREGLCKSLMIIKDNVRCIRKSLYVLLNAAAAQRCTRTLNLLCIKPSPQAGIEPPTGPSVVRSGGIVGFDLSHAAPISPVDRPTQCECVNTVNALEGGNSAGA